MNNRTASWAHACAITAAAAVAGCGSDVNLPISRRDAGACMIPPPAGFSQAVARQVANVEHTRLTFTRDNLPVIGYLVVNPATAGITVQAVRWEPCEGRWTAPVTVDTSANNFNRAHSLSITTDPVDGRIVIAYQKVVSIQMPNTTLMTWVATSTDQGATWATRAVSTHEVQTSPTVFGDINDTDHVEVLANGGATWVAYNQDGVACHPDPSTATGTRCKRGTVIAMSEGGAPFVQRLLTIDSLPAWTRPFQLGFALDGSGSPGIAAHLEPSPDRYNTALIYQHGRGGAVRIFDSGNVQNDSGYASLAYVENAPRVLSRLSNEAVGNETHDLVLSASDDGLAWGAGSAQIALPRDQGDRTAGAMALFAIGTRLVALSQVASADLGVAGGPKILRSVGGSVTAWTVGGASTETGMSAPVGNYVHGRSAGSKIALVYQGLYPARNTVAGGVVYWREP